MKNMPSKQQLINQIRVDVYEQALNKIDDYFEYAHESDKDKSFVREILSDVSSELETKIKFMGGY